MADHLINHSSSRSLSSPRNMTINRLEDPKKNLANPKFKVTTKHLKCGHKREGFDWKRSWMNSSSWMQFSVSLKLLEAFYGDFGIRRLQTSVFMGLNGYLGCRILI